jgi:serine/threonine-protein kinase
LKTETVLERGSEVEHTIEELISKYAKLVSVKRLQWAPDCRFTALLGEGGQGVVYLVKWPGADGFNNLLALKVFTPEHHDCPRNYVADMRRSAQVASIVARIRHNNVLDVQRFEQQDGIRMMLMEWIDGYDLRRLMVPPMLELIQHRNCEERCDSINRVVVTEGRTQPKLRPGMAVAIVRYCLDALDQMHAHGIVHGDIKFSNIMLKRNGHVKLIDIGSAFPWNESTQPYHCTYQYAAPEVLLGERYTPQSDLASLGYVLIELLSGCSLFENLKPGRELLEAKQLLPRRLPELLPERVQKCDTLVELCRRLVEPNPDRRFGSAREADLDLDCGALAFLDSLVRGDLATAYEHEIRLWLEALN